MDENETKEVSTKERIAAVSQLLLGFCKVLADKVGDATALAGLFMAVDMLKKALLDTGHGDLLHEAMDLAQSTKEETEMNIKEQAEREKEK